MLLGSELAKIIFYGDYKSVGKDVSYMIKTYDDVIYLCFQGTNSKQDIKLDICIFPERFIKLFAHGGAVKGWLSALNEVLKQLDFNKPLVICGHSLGGLYALLCGYTIGKLTNKKQTVIVYGTPKLVFGKRSLKELNKYCSTLAYENVMDVVPMLPPFYKKPKGTKLGKFNIKQFFKMSENHMSYSNDELY